MGAGVFQMQNLEHGKQYALWEIQQLEVLALTNIVNYSLQDTRQITAPFGFQTSGFCKFASNWGSFVSEEYLGQGPI